MPIEIKELIIKASVRDESERSTGKATAPPPSAVNNAAREEQLVTRCVEQVMAILKLKNER